MAKLGLHWKTPNPFLFCAFHKDDFPAGTAEMGVEAQHLRGRQLGSDFTAKDGFRMYHGAPVPGFPKHPHRGFETVTLAQQGLVDHSDSLGATGRFGNGDCQWITTGRGLQHSEMFPLLNSEEGNPLVLFQIWLNLPRRSKMAEPNFKMLWSNEIPVVRRDGARVTLVAGALDGVAPPSPPPNSWAADPESDVAIWLLELDAGASFELPPAVATSNRQLYLYEGPSAVIAGRDVPSLTSVELVPDHAVSIQAPSTAPLRLLLLQGRPINEPVVQHGPFVMNSRDEIRQTFMDYQQTEFGGWKWSSDSPIHPRDQGRFAIFPDGHKETPP